ncbi:P-loop containing nucleoside triphosphate hydrolase protein [Trichodelitschia bisporula]|uniref:P-loop containing nucleoside triphosphate hydrolase protein n=1 Tax=Trichodelitschia bisporula TaxID=703511 RepID=A0A6G1HSW0_9PEZI|nr:P-loop containing nucleoside triphosphate hydrolase protein [Trichodelitschia bisporula]
MARGHPPRGNQNKRPAKSVVEPDDGSNIVFTNSKDEPRKAKKPAAEETADESSKGKGKGPAKDAPPAEEAPKKPDTRTLIGGASWTGKLPVAILSERCQKQKWEKPEYTMIKTPAGFISGVILKATNPKTRETTVLPPFKFPREHDEVAAETTAVEARHFAAAYALFRMCSMQNLHMMMPPKYRDLWKGIFADIKKEDVAQGKAWIYEADPFNAHREREANIAAAAKKRAEIEKQKAKEQALPPQPGVGVAASSSSHSNRSKGWSKAPTVDMGKRTRIQVERLIRERSVWNQNSLQMSAKGKQDIIADVTTLGFRKSHVEEAAELCKDKEEILEWLLIHVPEDDLPGWSLPENYVAGISMASSDMKREGMIKRLSEAGYAADLCEEALDSCKGDEGRAAALLQNRFLEHTDDVDQIAAGLAESELAETDGEPDAWDEEQTILTSIFDERYEPTSKDTFQLWLQPEGVNVQVSLHARRPSGPYPNVLPILSLHAALPAYIRLSILKQALEYANVAFLGEQMLFNIVDWLEHNMADIIENPGRLTDVSAAAAAGEVKPAQPANGVTSSRRPHRPVNWTIGTPKSQRMFDDWKKKQTMAPQQKMLAVRRNLPAWSLQESIVTAVADHQITIISGETGSGKSTQSVQFILDDLIEKGLGEAANIICTQPRRISALGLADRVAEERYSRVGEEVGYIIRGESKVRPGETKITFVTTGVLLRRLQTSGGRPEDVVASLADVSHVVVDEVHERSLDTDFLLILLRDVLSQRRDLRLILMSATLDAGIFENYFRGVGPVARIEIQGRTHPVTDYYLDDVIRMSGYNGHNEEDDLEDEGLQKQLMATLRGIGMKINYDLIAHIVRSIDSELGHRDGAILIFLPGTMEIDRTLQALRQIPNIHALPLHASLLPDEQRRVFPPAPKGTRKVIASTNVAETSITIEDVVAVIDTGRVKETSFDPQNNMVKLEEVWASRAACKQRRGRAGRVREGACYKLYTRNAEAKMPERPEPEIRRVPLEQLCLSVKAMGVPNVPAFLAGALTPPDVRAVDGAIHLLHRMGALADDALTGLGRHLAMIPADLRCGKLLVYGATFACLEACLTIAAVLTMRPPFVSPQAKREESKAARLAFGQGHGDAIADLRAFEAWSAMRARAGFREVRTWCEANFLSFSALNDINSTRAQYVNALKEIGFLRLGYRAGNTGPDVALNAQNGNNALIRALIAGAFNPQLARIEFPEKKFAVGMAGAVELDPEARTIKFFTQDSGRVFVHPSSTVFGAQAFPGSSAFLAYFEKVATSKVFVRNLTPFNAYSLLMFSGPIALDTLGRGLIVDGWVRLRGWARIGVLVSRLRGMLDDVLSRKADDPGLDTTGDELMDLVRKLIELDGLDR